MSTIEKPAEVLEDHLHYLDDLRDSGVTYDTSHPLSIREVIEANALSDHDGYLLIPRADGRSYDCWLRQQPLPGARHPHRRTP